MFNLLTALTAVLGAVVGSDFPYVGFAEARSFLSQELDRHGFSPSEQADIFSGTASRVFGTVS
jgi:predicted TIM-barrel fold metal-dependent hydrolase